MSTNNDYRDLYLKLVNDLAKLSPCNKAAAISKDNRIIMTFVIQDEDMQMFDILIEAANNRIKLEGTILFLSQNYWINTEALKTKALFSDIIK